VRSVGIKEAEQGTKDLVDVEGRLVETAGLTDGLLHQRRKAIQKVDDVVLSQVLTSRSIVRVKIWSRDGTILYSDEPALIGQRYRLPPDEVELLESGEPEAELSDLTKPENRYERQEGKLLEAHIRIRTPNGTPVLFEIYQRFGSLSADAERLLRRLALPLLGGLVVLLLFQIPLVLSMVRRLQRGHREREELLASAIEASTRERRRIAADLHDGVVQDVAGVAFGLAPLAEDALRRGDEAEAGVLQGSMRTLRQGVRDLRTLLVQIHPASLESAGLEAALNDLLSPLQAEGISTQLRVDERATTGGRGDAMVYRVAREALRNVQQHAHARTVQIDVTRPDAGTTRLVVRDDGKGFTPADRERRGTEGHVGLSLLEALVRQNDGSLAIHGEPGKGTTVELEVPAR
jgi:two-component system, NarL family, sensor kinase